ncbi:ribosome recycling factor [Trichinella spiralis]|uniref:ribosome recycling factor n=1 Tax=Trichinella spiralis TaxID=6334 RepID=UPI0001EFEB16|nr:ribosome recycling factor [Trichinella spiralis]
MWHRVRSKIWPLHQLKYEGKELIGMRESGLKTGCLKTAMKRFMTAHTIQRRTHMRKGFLKIPFTKSKQRRTEVVRVLRRVRKQNNTHENTGSVGRDQPVGREQFLGGSCKILKYGSSLYVR